jgi:hypothetical protein
MWLEYMITGREDLYNNSYFKIFKYKDNDNEIILLQVISQVINKCVKDIEFFNIKKNKKLLNKQFGIYLTDAQYMEILYLNSFYTDLWDRERAFLLNVFINKHYIFAECQPGLKPQRTIEEELRVRSALKAMQNTTPNKAITHKLKGEK